MIIRFKEALVEKLYNSPRKTRVLVFFGILVGFMLCNLVSIWSLDRMTRDNTKAMNTMLATRIHETIVNSVNEPMDVTKTMAATKYLKETLQKEGSMDDAEFTGYMRKYLAELKYTFDYDTAFVVSDKTKRYYTYDEVKTIDPVNKTEDLWYSFFVDHKRAYDISIDTDNLLPGQWIIFSNARVEDDNGQLLGVCGVGVNITDLQELFRALEKKYHVKINLVDKNGLVKLDTNNMKIDQVYLGKESIEKDTNEGYIYNSLNDGSFSVTKYVDNLNWYLVITGSDTAFNHDFAKIIAINVLLFFLIVTVVFLFMLVVLKSYDLKERETALLTRRMTAAAQIYLDFQEINLITNTFENALDYRINQPHVTHAVQEDAQQKFLLHADSYVDETCRKQLKEFLDFSTLDERLDNRKTIATEFLTTDKRWMRGRFIVSQYTSLGKVSTVLWLVENITEERQSREALMDISAKATAASNAKSAFLSQMSHEIRTPINTVLGMNEMILRESKERQTLDYAENIRTAGTSLMTIINDVLDFSKIEAGKMEILPAEYDLSSMVHDLMNMIKPMADAKGLSLILEISADTPKLLRGDEVRIKQVITNLLTNAVKYTKKGCVTFAIGYKQHDERQALLHVSVKDTGQGIREEDLPKLFDQYERVNEMENRYVEGTGLGLAITRRLLEMMGSTLEVESVYKLGSHFHFTLQQEVIAWDPIGDCKAAHKDHLTPHSSYHEKFNAPDANVLVVDDDQLNTVVFRNLLKKTGVRIDTAYSGDEALSMTREKKYDIIFLDHMMPEKDGIETLKEMRSRKNDPNKETPAICLTANAVSGAREQYLSYGFNDYLTKPINPGKLEQILMTYLSSERILERTEDEPPVNEDSPEKKPAASNTSDKFPLLPDSLKQATEIDVAVGLENNGGEEYYLEALKLYADGTDKYAEEISSFMAAGDIENATTKIHALKSTSRIIGAIELGERAQELENAGKAGDRNTLEREVPDFLKRYLELGHSLKPLLEASTEEPAENLPEISPEELKEAFGEILAFAGKCDSYNIDVILKELQDFQIPHEEQERFNTLLEAASNFDFERIKVILSK